MFNSKKRKEISLDEETIKILEIQAQEEGRSLKNFMENKLRETANNYKLSDTYKVMMDELLEKHDRGLLNYIDEKTFRMKTNFE